MPACEPGPYRVPEYPGQLFLLSLPPQGTGAGLGGQTVAARPGTTKLLKPGR